MSESTPASGATRNEGEKFTSGASWRVLVGVALSRPPRLDQWRKVIVSASSETEAQLIACQIAACTSVMPVCAHIEREGIAV